MEEAKQLINEAKNICLVPSQTNEPESLTAALALFYTLKELNKNVNLIIQDFPEKFNFLVPSLDFITSPKNFVISIPQSVAEVSQIYYEKNEENLKIYLTVDKGRVKKEDVSFYFSNAKPDLVITLGIKDLQSQLSEQLDSFGFILDVPILNIDSSASLTTGNQEPFDATQGENKKFGKINLIEQKSISEITLEIIKSIDENLVKKDVANCILTGLIIHYENFKKSSTSPEIFHIAAELIKKGALQHQIHDNLHKMTKKEMHFFSSIFQNLQTADNYEGSFATLQSNEFQHFGKHEANFAVEKIKTIGIQGDLLVLWQSHLSDPIVKGFFYSRKTDLINKIAGSQKAVANNDWVFLSIPSSDINMTKDKIINLLR